jgi:hypothetical protein
MHTGPARSTVLVLALLAVLLQPTPASSATASDPPARHGAASEAAAPATTFHTYRGGRARLERMKPGTVIRTRTVPYSVQGLATPLRVVQLLFRTTDARGRATTSVTSVIRPPVALHPDRVIAYGSFYDSLNHRDGPSYALAGGRSSGGSAVHAEVALVLPFLLEGYPVVMADTQGRTADFAAGPEYGQVTLDSLRAVLRSPRAGIAPRPRIGLIGYSGGAIATNWAAALAPSYAPDIDRRLVGAAEGGVLVAPAHNLGYVEGSQVWAGVMPMALVGAARAYGIDLAGYMSPYGRRLFRDLQDASIAEVLGAYPGLTWRRIARREYRRPESVPIYVRTVNKLNLGRAPVPTVPMFIGQGTGGRLEGTPDGGPGVGAGDGVMIAGDVRALARRYCRAGLRVQYRQYDLSHFTAVPLWLPEAIAWLRDRFTAAAAPTSCGSIARGNSLAPVRVRR